MHSQEITNKQDYWVMQPCYGSEDKVRVVDLDFDLILLKIKANPADPILFATFYCASCNTFVPIGGLFPANAKLHLDHYLARLPSIDAVGNPLANWLAQASITIERRSYLQQLVFTTSTLNWVWVCNEAEYDDWLGYLDAQLEDLVASWLEALNGQDNQFFRAATIWQTLRPTHLLFRSASANE
jgi:hypothetical protein